MKLQTPVEFGRSAVRMSLSDRIAVLGSCFADNIGKKLANAGFNVCVNPFGTLYNPVSIGTAAARLAAGTEFGPEDCVEMGAGAGLVCSFWHHTSFARPDVKEFLKNANECLRRDSAFWKECNKVIVSLGTIRCFRCGGYVVSNCLKLPQSQFERFPLSFEETVHTLLDLVDSCPDKQFLFTVSPVRHLADGAHANQLSKSTLLLAVDSVCRERPGICEYFPAFEIVMDELRDYRFYAEDMSHPSQQAVDYIWERFLDFAFLPEERQALRDNERAFLRSQHRPLH